LDFARALSAAGVPVFDARMKRLLDAPILRSSNLMAGPGDVYTEAWQRYHDAIYLRSMAAARHEPLPELPEGFPNSVQAAGGFTVLRSGRNDADLVTAMPREEVVTWAEKLAVPLVMQFGTFAFLPLALSYRLKSPTLSTAIGQYMLFRKAAYEAIGGYAAVRQAAVDDLTLARRTVACGRRWRMADATGEVHCRMYQSPRQVFEGFGKNLFAGFDYRILPCMIAWLWLSIVFVQPWLTLLAALMGVQIAPLLLTLSAIQIVLALTLFGLFYRRFELPLYLTCCYPLAVLMGAVLAFRSIFLTLRGRSTWKGRTLLKPKVRLW
jgi:chlorobactene glucosyltransferase